MLKLRTIVPAAAILVSAGITARGGTMTFDGTGLAVDSTNTAPYTEDGLTLNTDYFYIAGPSVATSCGLGGCVNDGTNVAVVTTPATITDASGTFTLNSFDYDYPFEQSGDSTSLTVTGTLAAGGTVSEMLSLAPGGFQTSTVDWAGLASVEFDTQSFVSLDNIVTTETGSGAPEPSTIALAMSFVAVVAGFRRRLCPAGQFK